MTVIEMKQIRCQFLPIRRKSSSVSVEFKGGDDEAKNEIQIIPRYL